MLGLIVTFECFVARNWLDFTDPVSLSWRFSAESIATESQGCELLCLGDSLVKHGLIPRMIEESTGLRTANLSAARAPALLTYFMLRRTVKAGARPKAVIINAKPAILLAGLQFNGQYWQEHVNLREYLDLAALARNGPFCLTTLVGRILPSLRGRLQIQSNVLATLRGEHDQIGAVNRILWRNWSVNRGANIAAADAHPGDQDGRDIEHRLHPGAFFVDRTNAAGLEWIMQLAEEEGISIFWLLPPLSRDLQARRDQSGSEAKYEQLVRSYQERYPRVLTVLDARRGDYAASLFADQTHLNGAGAVFLSRAVANAIKPALASLSLCETSSWLTLDLPTDHRVVPMEDLDQSREILRLSQSRFTIAR
jgi:hypothetical protein